MQCPALPLARFSSRGFTLVELAIVLVIVALLAGGLMITMTSQIDQRQRSEARQQLEDARDALLGYAAAHIATDGKPHLPCPDTDDDGLENRDGDLCTSASGFLPNNDLGLSRQDPWGNRIRYHVHANLARRDVGFKFSTTGDLRLCEQAACVTVIAASLPVVLIAGGRNGVGSDLDELENNDGDRDYVSHPPSGADAGAFDDLVIWLSPNILFNRMIAAGRLP